MTREQRALRVSATATFGLAVFGIGFGLLTRSGAILFDGTYSLLDTFSALLMLLVVRLISSAGSGSKEGKLVERFTLGFWHLEPIVVGVSGTLLIGSASYALFSAVDALLKGGRDLEFGLAILYASLTLCVALSMTFFMRRANRRLNSAILAIDVTGWMISSALTAALLIAFVTGWLTEGTGLAWIRPYIDPGILALICLMVLPLPVPAVRQALAEILLITPADLKQEVDQKARALAKQEGFLSHRAYVARVGRGTQIEIYFIVPKGLPPRPLEEWDAIRDRLGEALGGEGPHRWLTIAFTTDQDWAE